MLRVAIEATGLIISPQTGIQRYTTCLIDALYHEIKNQKDIRLYLYTNSGAQKTDRQLLEKYQKEYPFALFRDWPFRRGYRMVLSGFSTLDQAQVIHFPDPSWMHFSPCPAVITVHDLCWRKLPEEIISGEKNTMGSIDQAIQKASAYIAVSKSTSNDLIDEFSVQPSKTWVISEGVGTEYQPAAENDIREIRQKYQLGQYILCVSTYQHRKNLPRLIRGFSEFLSRSQANYDLVLVGSNGWGNEDVYEAARKSPCSNHIKLLNYAPKSDLQSLYSGAELFIYPSLYEGFGLPVIEAMSCGTPVAVANNSSLPEVVGNAGIYFDPYNENEIAGAIEMILNTPAVREEMGRKGLEQSRNFRWKTTAEATLRVYQEIARSSGQAAI
jgi:glycosyltransferase involved in cell wall biosynthesis